MRKLFFICTLLLCLVSCSDVNYYLHSATGHLQVLRKRQSISQLLQQKDTPQKLQDKLSQIETIRNFASQSLQLPENNSYRSYVKLDRPYVVWNIVATPEFSLEPLQWCFPIVGCVNYRGYFDQDEAEQFAEILTQESYDTTIIGVPAYSTLNWFDDPVLSTFSDWPTAAIAKLIFHELAHQKLYLPDDTVFNESFATAVEEIGMERWLQQIKDPNSTQIYRQQGIRQQQFHALLLETRLKLSQLYASSLPKQQKRWQKQQLFTEMRDSYQQLRSRWQNYPGYDAWFNQLNNARFASINNYQRWVPAFKLAMQQEGDDLSRFYLRCKSIANLPSEQRQQLLEHLSANYQLLAKGLETE